MKKINTHTHTQYTNKRSVKVKNKSQTKQYEASKILPKYHGVYFVLVIYRYA